MEFLIPPESHKKSFMITESLIESPATDSMKGHLFVGLQEKKFSLVIIIL